MNDRRITRMVVMAATLAMTTLASNVLRAQETGEEWARWWYGIYGGANINMFSGAVRNLTPTNQNVGGTTGFESGSGLGLALGGIVEYNSGGLLGGNLMIGYDNRAVTFDQVTDTAGTRHDLSTGLAYLTIEPNLRLNLGGRFLHLMLGPSFAINIAKPFTYISTPTGGTATTTNADLDNVRSFVIGGQAGVGYDIPLTGSDANTQVLLTPFAQFRLGQELLEQPTGATTTNEYSLNSIRAGLQLKFGSRPVAILPPPPDGPPVDFTLRAPNVVTDSRKLNETFPLRNYIFFDAGSTELPARYKRLSPSDASSFREEQLLRTSVETGGGDALQIRSRHQMEVYYNGLNVVGDRMRRNPSVNIRLVGSANGDQGAGAQMAENVKSYLTSAFGIDPKRITAEGRAMPVNRSGSGTSQGEDKRLIDEENTRVEIIGPDEIVRPVNIISTQEAPVDNDIVIGLPQRDDIAYWNIEFQSGDETPQTFGPYRTNTARIDSKTLLGAERSGRYRVRMVATMKNGKTATTEPKDLRLVRADEGEEQTGTRYSILFEFDQSKTVQTYEKFLTETVAPQIPTGSTVIIHGHTDNIGEPEYNAKLSQERSEAAQTILTKALTQARKSVTFDTYGFGEDDRRSQFNNNLPEQRYYNRTVVIEVVPPQ